MSQTVTDSVNDPNTPFGLPAGSVRGFISVLICSFFWAALLIPQEIAARPLLAHFFLLTLVFSAFVSSPRLGIHGRKSILPWLFRTIFVGVSLAVLIYAWYRHPDQIQARLTPNPAEMKEWWMTYLGSIFGGFAAGLLIRGILGRENPFFRTLRAWISVIAILMLLVELVLFLGVIGSDTVKLAEFLRWWQAFEVAIVAAYFGTRA